MDTNKSSTSNYYHTTSGNASDTDSDSSLARCVEALLLLQDTVVTGTISTPANGTYTINFPSSPIAATPLPFLIEKGESESTYENFMNYLTIEENKLPEELETCMDMVLKIYILWAKTLKEDVPDLVARSQFMEYTRTAIKRINGFRTKVLNGLYHNELCPEYLQDLGQELDNFRHAINEQIKCGSSPSSSSTATVDVPPVTEKVLMEFEYDADNEDTSESVKEEKTTTDKYPESIPLQEHDDPELSHVQFLLYLTLAENDLNQPARAIFDSPLERFITWARTLENDIDENVNKYRLREFRYKFRKFAKESIENLRELRNIPDTYEGVMLEIMLQEVSERFKKFRVILQTEYFDICDGAKASKGQEELQEENKEVQYEEEEVTEKEEGVQEEGVQEECQEEVQVESQEELQL